MKTRLRSSGLRSPSFHKYLNPGELAQLRYSKFTARSKKIGAQTLLALRQLQSGSDSAFAQPHLAMDVLPCFNLRVTGHPRLISRSGCLVAVVLHSVRGVSASFSVSAVLFPLAAAAAAGGYDFGVDPNVDSEKQSFDLKPKVANLEDILSERGACGVGFIANLDNKASHGIVSDALTALGCMEHRGGCGADNDSGDGSGLMTSIPWDLFNTWASEQGTGAFDPVHTGVGMIFLPKDADLMKQAQAGGADGGDVARLLQKKEEDKPPKEDENK